MAERNSNIWEARLKMAEFHKEHYKDTARQLVEENTSLVDYMKQSEKDSMEVVAYLRKVDTEKDGEVLLFLFYTTVISLLDYTIHLKNR